MSVTTSATRKIYALRVFNSHTRRFVAVFGYDSASISSGEDAVFAAYPRDRFYIERKPMTLDTEAIAREFSDWEGVPEASASAQDWAAFMLTPDTTSIQVGDTVCHVSIPEWTRGTVLALSGGTADVLWDPFQRPDCVALANIDKIAEG